MGVFEDLQSENLSTKNQPRREGENMLSFEIVLRFSIGKEKRKKELQELIFIFIFVARLMYKIGVLNC